MKWKRIKLILFGCLFLTYQVKAQVYFENNTKYYYQGIGNAEYPKDWWIVKKIKLDSIINSVYYYSSFKQEYKYRILSSNYEESVKFIQDKYKVFTLKKEGGQTLKLLKYDFEKNKGDTMYLNIDKNDDTLKVLIDSTKNTLVAGRNRKIQFVSINFLKKVYKFQLIEGLGCFSNNLTEYDPGLLIQFPSLDVKFPCTTICINNNLVFKSNPSQLLETKDCQWDTVSSPFLVQIKIRHYFSN